MTDPLDVIASVRQSCREADGNDPLDEAATLRLKHRGLSGTAHWVADTDGFALIRDGQLDLAVAPGSRARGIGGRLAEQALATVTSVTAWSHGDHPAAARLAERHGLARIRELWVMRRPSSAPLPELVLPPGVTIRGYRDADAAAVISVNAAAFAAHPEQGEMDAANLAERMAEPWFDPDGLLIAEDADGSVLGFHWTKRQDDRLGEVYVVGIAPTAQGRGLGRLLTLAGLHHLVAGGVDEVLLYVESDNSPAIHVYSGLGFDHAPEDTHVQYRR
ncbi:MAG: mycothiol synthase [Actinomycetota bacterium]|nr:mycothiol synthase [Actinomycetota bacterium]